jgi:DNA-binding transcriptional MerR regulator
MAEHGGGNRGRVADEGLTRKQVADRLGVSIATVRRLEESGELVPRRVGEREERRFDPEAVEVLAEARTSATGIDPEDAPEARPQDDRKIAWGDIFWQLERGARASDLMIEHGLHPTEMAQGIKWFAQIHGLESAIADRIANEEHLAERLDRLEGAVNFLLSQQGRMLG